MKIAGSDVLMQSERFFVKKEEIRESLRAWVGDQRPDFEGSGRNAGVGAVRDSVFVSDAAMKKRAAEETSPVEGGPDLSSREGVNLLILKALLERLTGKRIDLIDGKKFKNREIDPELQKLARTAQAGAAPRAGFGVEYDHSENRVEAEVTTFSADGVVQTADGRSITISIELTMSRLFASEQNVSVRSGDAKLKDPLVINFNGAAAQLTDRTFSFDIDFDGNPEQLFAPAPNTGFLALDANEDGTVNGGAELFGPTTGHGFAELAQHDSDGNQWIDENDPVFGRLRVWFNDGQGNQRLVALADVGMGAIYLGNVRTAFDLKESPESLRGRVQSTGIYLNEDGSAGTIQEVDLRV
jgi:hypothetical protein